MCRINNSFFLRDVLEVAPEILGANIITQDKNGCHEHLITEVEAYRGEEDLACHASKGRTPRTEVMYHKGGHIYVYLIYGMYWMLNIVTGKAEQPQAILVRGVKGCSGPGKVGKLLNIDKSFYGENLCSSKRIWIEKKSINHRPEYITQPRVNIDYSGPIWKNKPWRYILI